MNLVVFLKLPRDEMTNLIIKYLVDKKLSNQYKNLMNALSTHMNMLFTLIISLIIVGSAGVLVNFLVESVDVWHSQFETKKECTNFMKNVVGNTTAEANMLSDTGTWDEIIKLQ